MLLDVCLEASGSYAHLIGVDVVNSLLPAGDRARRRLPRLGRVVGTLSRPDGNGHVTTTDGFDRLDRPEPFDARLSAAMDRLPILLAHVVWLIDVCACTYETAAAELGTSPAEVARLVAEARHQLRDDLVSDPRRSSAGSTSPSPPGWQPPDR